MKHLCIMLYTNCTPLPSVIQSVCVCYCVCCRLLPTTWGRSASVTAYPGRAACGPVGTRYHRFERRAIGWGTATTPQRRWGSTDRERSWSRRSASSTERRRRTSSTSTSLMTSVTSTQPPDRSEREGASATVCHRASTDATSCAAEEGIRRSRVRWTTAVTASSTGAATSSAKRVHGRQTSIGANDRQVAIRHCRLLRVPAFMARQCTVTFPQYQLSVPLLIFHHLSSCRWT